MSQFIRIISGQHKGRKLFLPKVERVRPTQNRVREAVFSILGERVVGAQVLDMFAGTGSMGIEALSRGAAFAAFVEPEPETLQKNTYFLKEEGFRIFKMPVQRFFRANKGKHYDLIFIDPPWSIPELYEVALKGISEFELLSKSGIIVCEHPEKIVLQKGAALPSPYEGEGLGVRSYQYGSTRVTIFGL